MSVERDGDRWAVAGSWFRLHGTTSGPVARLDELHGSPWADLRLLASVDAIDGRDETLAIEPLRIEPGMDGGARLTWELASSRWTAKRLVIDADENGLAIHAEVEGSGRIGEVSLLSGDVVLPRTTGRLMSGAWFESIVSGGPADPGRIVRPATESADIGVTSGSEPGRGAWFFSPGPFVHAASREQSGDGVAIPRGPWLSFGLLATAGEAGFNGFGYRAFDRGFGFALAYDGKTAVDGSWRTPALVIRAATDPYDAVVAWRTALEASGLVPVSTDRTVPDWWLQPMFCGWGAQAALARVAGQPLSATATYATQANYERFLGELAALEIHPGTVVVDDKWEAAYGSGDPDPTSWPDLRGWIARRHDAGQRVLLWYKAWDAEGVPAEACVRSAGGVPLAVDPSHPLGETAIRRSIGKMLAAEGLAADGLKIDFTARTPSGVATSHHGPAWGVDLLRLLLDTVADEARHVASDALLIGHTPNPLVSGAVGMLRLNDMLRLDDPPGHVDLVAQMRHRAALVRAACPGVPIDTDDWSALDLAGWRAYAAVKTDLGVPALYYTTTIDRTRERLTAADHELIRRTWADYRSRLGLGEPGLRTG